MTGTAKGHQRELLANYGLPMVIIPLREPSQRLELTPRYYSSEENKIDAIVTDLIDRNCHGQPVLVGTRTIEQCHRLSARLTSEGIRHEVLNGMQDAEEATLVGQAGCFGSVTIATNMAGRGTDIKPDNAALEAGGLHVIGFERNQSRRIDRQLLGRAGRQGEPGSGQFHVSADDEIVLRYDAGFSKILRRLSHVEEGNPNAVFDQRIQKLQSMAERESYQSRCEVMREELWLDDVKKALS
jgi:preprotein translocase subunit SecA